MRVTPIRAGALAVLAGTAPPAPATAQSYPAELRDPGSGPRVWQFPGDTGGMFHLVVLVGVGRVDERSEHAGISHFLEHCLFLSTELRGEAERTDALRDRSGATNGETSHDFTAFYVSVPDDTWGFAVDWLTELLARPAFVAEEIERERRIVVEEIATRHGHSGVSLFGSELYDDHPLGRTVGGTRATVEATAVEDLREWYERYYRSGNLVVAFAGDVPLEECTARVRERLANLPPGSVEREVSPPTALTGDVVLPAARRSGSERPGFLRLGYHAPVGDADDLAALLLVSEVLSAAVFDEVRTERGLAYAPTVRMKTHRQTWRLDCTVEVSDAGNLPAVQEGIEVAVARAQAVERDDFDRARGNVHARLGADSAAALLEATRLTWLSIGAGRDDGAPAPDLRAAVRSIAGDELRTRVDALLQPERRYRITDSAALVRPAYRGVIAGLLGAVAGAAAWLWLRQRPGAPRPRPVKRRERREPDTAKKEQPDVDQLERDFQRMFADDDAGRNDPRV